MALFSDPVTTPVDAQGDPYSGAKRYFYLAGTLTPATVYSDSALTTALSNPVVANASGQFVPIYLDPAVEYRTILRDASDVLLRDNDNITASTLTADGIGAALYERTASEISVGVTPTDYQYPPLDIRRYGAVGDNSTLCSTAINNAVLVAAVNGGTVYIPPGRFKITASISTAAKVNFRGDGYASVIEANACHAFLLDFTTGFGKVVFEDFAIAGTDCEAKYAIYQAGTLDDADELYGLTFSRLLITDFNTCLKFRNARVVTIQNCWLQDTNVGIDLTGKCLVFNIVGNEIVYASGCGSGDTIAVNLDLFNFTSGSGLTGPEGIQIERNQLYGFNYGVVGTYCFFLNIVGNDMVALIQGVQFETCQYVLNIKNNYIEMQTATATAGIIGLGLGSTISTQVNIEGNGIDGSTLTTCNGIQINESGNTNQYHVRIVGNRVKSMTANDILLYAAGHVTVEDNRCESTGATYSIKVDSVSAGVVHVDKNRCYKDIYFDTAEAASGEVVLGVNYKNNGTTQVGSQHVPTVASASTIAIPLGADIVKISGTTAITSITATGWTGRRVTLIFESTPTFTDGGNLKIAGNLVATADDSITVACDGTNWFEIGRAVN